MEDWKEYRLGEMIQCNPQVKLEKGKSYNLIDIDSIEIGSRYVKGKELTVYDGQSGCHFQNGDTVMARITPCLENGKIAQVQCESQKGFGSTELFVFRGTENKTDSDYVFNLMSMQFIRNLAANSMTGASGRQRADLGFIKRIKWNFPPLPTQQKIASILSAYDNLIQNYKKQIEALQTGACELYKEWFVRFRFPGYQTTNFENGIPEGWKYKRIFELYNTTSGGTPSRTNSSYYENGTIPWVKTGELLDTLITDTEEYITEEGLKNSSAKMIDPGSLLCSMYAGVGKLGINVILMTCSQATCVFTPKTNISIWYLFFWLMRNKEYLESISFGAAQQNISQDIIKKIIVLFPPESVTLSFDKKIKPIYKKIQNLMQQITNLTQQRDLLLPRLMSGKLEVE